MQESTIPNHTPKMRLAFSPAEYAAACGRHPTWAYRLIYKGELNVVTSAGRMLIPASEIEKQLGTAAPYNPKPKKKKQKEGAAE